MAREREREREMNAARLEAAYRRAVRQADGSGYSVRAVISIQPYARELFVYLEREHPGDSLE